MSEANPGARYPTVLTEQVCNTVPNGDGLWFPGVSDGAYWQLVTNAFTHVEVWHIGFNMLALWVLGPQLELAIGRARFLALYFLSALAGSTLVYWSAATTTATLGASGAVFGLMGALLVLALKVGGNVQQIADVDRHQLPDHRGLAAARSPGRATSAGSSAALLIAVVLVYAPRAHRTLWQVGRPVRDRYRAGRGHRAAHRPAHLSGVPEFSTAVDSHVENYTDVINTLSTACALSDSTGAMARVKRLTRQKLVYDSGTGYPALHDGVQLRQREPAATPSGWRR